MRLNPIALLLFPVWVFSKQDSLELFQEQLMQKCMGSEFKFAAQQLCFSPGGKCNGVALLQELEKYQKWEGKTPDTYKEGFEFFTGKCAVFYVLGVYSGFQKGYYTAQIPDSVDSLKIKQLKPSFCAKTEGDYIIKSVIKEMKKEMGNSPEAFKIEGGPDLLIPIFIKMGLYYKCRCDKFGCE
jgi:hypothetical protein